MYIDTHAHLNMPEYFDLAEVLKRASDAGVSTIIDVSFDMESARRSVKLSDSYYNIFSAVGVHPHDAEAFSEKDHDELMRLAAGGKVVAIGETGLDYYKNLSPKDAQIRVFRRHIELAQQLGLPLIVHSRDSHDDTLRTLHEENKGSLKGVMHCFSGGVNEAKLVLDLGFYISFAGPITFKNAEAARETAKYVPLDRILIETDCPYLSPVPFRGKRNEPSYVVHIASKLAEVKNVPEEEVSMRTNRNAEALFTKLKV